MKGAIVKVNEHNGITIGDELTINGEIISTSGYIMFNKGDKVTVSEIWVTEGFWSSFGYYVEERLHCVKLVGYAGTYLPNAFEEFSKSPNQ